MKVSGESRPGAGTLSQYLDSQKRKYELSLLLALSYNRDEEKSEFRNTDPIIHRKCSSSSSTDSLM